MKRIHELQNTRGQELSGIQITAYFLRIRVQPLQARKNPLWMYVGDKDVDRVSKDLPDKDLEKLVRKISSLSKKDAIPTSCRVAPYSGTNALPQKRGDAEGSGTSKLSSSPVEEIATEGTAPEGTESFNAYDAALIISGDDEEEETGANVTAPTSTSHTLALSDTHRTVEETSSPHPDLQRSTPATSPRASSPKRARIELGGEFNITRGSSTPPLDDPLMQPFINLGTQFIGYRNTVDGLKEALLAADKRADDLAVKLKESEKAREKAEKDASSVEDLRKRLHKAETALSDKITHQIACEENIISRLESLNRRFVRKTSQDFELQKPEDDRLIDALSLLEIHGDLVHRSIFDAQTAFSRLFPYFFPKAK
ncbi:hypothetical protein QYE76_000384 [Lolium multiflorum]|uniref:Uncharacterized protein n=1 Tax=Lolium multiflorum TaxID=4521 RepID=A0AAD8RJ59_LOLMU|nr:hypothetical protein QYE76_000384 [Lolium multiflorum]